MITIELDSGEQDLLYGLLEEAYYSDKWWGSEMQPLIRRLMDKVQGY